MYRKSLAMKYLIHGEDAMNSYITPTLDDLGIGLEAQGKLGDAEIMERKKLATANDWEGVALKPLQPGSDSREIEVSTLWAQKFLSADNVNQHLAMLNELEKIGKDFVEEMKKVRKDACYARMQTIPYLTSPTKVAIRGRNHAKLNPFVKEQNAKVRRVITVWLLEQIPVD